MLAYFANTFLNTDKLKIFTFLLSFQTLPIFATVVKAIFANHCTCLRHFVYNRPAAGGGTIFEVWQIRDS